METVTHNILGLQYEQPAEKKQTTTVAACWSELVGNGMKRSSEEWHVLGASIFEYSITRQSDGYRESECAVDGLIGRKQYADDFRFGTYSRRTAIVKT